MKQNTKIILVRHGETDYNKAARYQGRLDVPLNKRGITQAQRLSNCLKNIPVDIIVSSPLQRALVTAKICAAHRNCKVRVDNRLLEIDHGKWTGQYISDLKTMHGADFALWREKPWLFAMPGGENLFDLKKRACAAFYDIADEFAGKTALIAAHGTVNAVLLCSVLGRGLESFNNFPQENACINILRYDGSAWLPALIGFTEHLNDEGQFDTALQFKLNNFN